MHSYNTFAAADAGQRAKAVVRAVLEIVRRIDDRPHRVAVSPHGAHGVSVRIYAPDDVASIVMRPDRRALILAPDDGGPGPWREFTTAPGLEHAIDLHLTRQIEDESMRAITAGRDQADLMRELLAAITAEPALRLEPLVRAG